MNWNKSRKIHALIEILHIWLAAHGLMKRERAISKGQADWGFPYGEWSVGQNDFEKAFFIVVEELRISRHSGIKENMRDIIKYEKKNQKWLQNNIKIV